MEISIQEDRLGMQVCWDTDYGERGKGTKLEASATLNYKGQAQGPVPT